ncbi:hypothetical protein MHM98_01500 [Psychrobium sp. MM17-31]|uniref:exonuclease domain-containing protein n=1 Tax=Psychrobium sp. MM17-31 TaxID=2917758 RepID=UPI001EF723F1|nr:exonuclease domain-containing protein [Psychrobium sp. MM17-31]MCG7530038.1 hypothetical protein [Psychrobium sp. MM17-31]
MSLKDIVDSVTRKRLARKAREQTAIDFIRAKPDLSLPFDQTELLAVDLEMTGLNAKQHEIISMGWVPIINGEIKLAQARNLLITPSKSVGDSATIHGIHDRDLTDALTLKQALEELLHALKGRVMVGHHVSLDVAFLRQAATHIYQHTLPFSVIDTLHIEAARLSRQGEHFDKQLLRLNNSAERYGFPSGDAHNALGDALTTAQLLLAQVASIGPPPLTLKQLLKFSH